MCGQSQDDEIVQDRAAILSHYVIQLYDTAWQEWWNHHPELRSEIASKAMTIEWMQSQQPAGHGTLFDCYVDLKAALTKNPEKCSVIEYRIQEYYRGLSNEKITEYIIGNDSLLRNLSYAYMKHTEQKTCLEEKI